MSILCFQMFLFLSAGTALLPVVTFPFEDFFIDKHYVLHTLAKKKQEALFYIALLATCLGSGGIRAIVCPLSVYNPDEHRPKELLSFFNWSVPGAGDTNGQLWEGIILENLKMVCLLQAMEINAKVSLV